MFTVKQIREMARKLKHNEPGRDLARKVLLSLSKEKIQAEKAHRNHLIFIARNAIYYHG